MARAFSKSLTLRLFSLPNRPIPPPSLCLRSRSNHSPSDADPLSDADSLSAASSDQLIRKLEDAIQCIVARRSAPDWTPFRPGSSYWVPPIPAGGSHALPQLLEKLANPLSSEESLSTTTVRGWPSLSFFVQGSPLHPVELVGKSSNSLSRTEDDEDA